MNALYLYLNNIGISAEKIYSAANLEFEINDYWSMIFTLYLCSYLLFILRVGY